MKNSHADFISELPDALLLNIFSFIDETTIIQSSVLSRRWRYLWTLVPFPEHAKQTRYYFKTQKTDIQEEKLRLEMIAEDTVSKLTINVAKSIGLYCVHALLITMLGLLMFGVVHFFLTLVNMLNLYFWCRNCHSRLKCFDEASMRLQKRDSRLTFAANSYENCSRKMELLFCDDFQTRYAEMAKLFGMLYMMVVSCIIVVLRWEMEFILGRNGSIRIVFGYLGLFSFLIHLGYLLCSWSSTLLQYFLHKRLISPVY